MRVWSSFNRCLLPALALILPGVVREGFSPIVLTGASYNQDLVVENSAPEPVIAGGYTTASMDSGLGNSSSSWYEQGYNSANPTTGLPPAGSSFTSQSAGNHQYTMAPSFTAPNAVLLDSTLTSATLTLVTPTAYAGLSFPESGGHNGVSFTYTVHLQNGTTDTGTKSIPDYFNGSNPA